MKLKQPAGIQPFLIEEFGAEKGSALFSKQEETLRELIDRQKNKSKTQMKTLAGTILPSVALYQTLLQDCGDRDAAMERMARYQLGKAAQENHAFTARVERIPGFFALYSSIFRRIVRGADLWQSTQSHDRDHFNVTITKCLWHDTCVDCGCPELCRLFCESDNVNYGGLRKMGFTRNTTIGCGGDCCDFHFYRK